MLGYPSDENGQEMVEKGNGSGTTGLGHVTTKALDDAEVRRWYYMFNAMPDFYPANELDSRTNALGTDGVSTAVQDENGSGQTFTFNSNPSRT